MSAPAAYPMAPVVERADRADRADGLTARLTAVRRLAALIQDRAIELEEAAVTALPFPRSVIRGDIALAVRRLEAYGSLAVRLDGRHPLGTVALCLPGNAILSNPVATTASSYLAGNRTVLRLPRRRAYWADTVAGLLREAFGPQLELRNGTGASFIQGALEDPAIQAVMVFGDDSWAKDYEAAARRTGTTFIFEGPGKDPFLVLAGADPVQAARAAVAGAFHNAGQACTATERVYVLRHLYPRFVATARAAAAALTPGHPADPATRIGPLDEAGADRVLRQLDEARAAGAELLPAGSPWPVRIHDRRMLVIPPVIVLGADHSMSLLREETFGPVLPVIAVDSAEEAIELAEDSPYGLAATIYGGGPKVAERLARSHGEVFRDETWLDRRRRGPVGPYGGRRASGWVWETRGGCFVHRDGPRLNVLEFSRPANSDRTNRAEPDMEA